MNFIKKRNIKNYKGKEIYIDILKKIVKGLTEMIIFNKIKNIFLFSYSKFKFSCVLLSNNHVPNNFVSYD